MNKLKIQITFKELRHPDNIVNSLMTVKIVLLKIHQTETI